jgi:hypothetical protein
MYDHMIFPHKLEGNESRTISFLIHLYYRKHSQKYSKFAKMWVESKAKRTNKVLKSTEKIKNKLETKTKTKTITKKYQKISKNSQK